MPETIKLWTVRSGNLERLQETGFSELHKEKELEDWVEKDPSLLGRDLVILGRQVRLPSGLPMDLLALDASGRLIVIEFKRQQSTRDTIAQILDYASSLQSMTVEGVKNLTGVSGDDLSELTDTDAAMIVVAADADESVSRIANYLSRKARLSIEVVTFTFARTAEGQEVIARSIQLPESPAMIEGPSEKLRLQDILRIAEERGVLQTFKILNRVTELGWPPEIFGINGGTIRYWIEAGKEGRVLLGINVGGNKYKSPAGSLDVWLWPETAAAYSRTSVDSVWADLEDFPELKKSKRLYLRISDEATAENLLRLLQRWDATSAVKQDATDAIDTDAARMLV